MVKFLNRLAAQIINIFFRIPISLPGGDTTLGGERAVLGGLGGPGVRGSFVLWAGVRGSFELTACLLARGARGEGGGGLI